MNYSNLAYGNIRDSSIKEILTSNSRIDLLSQDIDSDMKCRVCDRKDEKVNLELSRIFNNRLPSDLVDQISKEASFDI